MKNTVFTALLGCVILWHTGGCLRADMSPIERNINTVMTKVVAPAVAKVTDELSARTAQMQGQGSVINPGYEVSGFATAGPAVTYKFSIRAVGASANLSAATQGDAGQAGSVAPPANRRRDDVVPPPMPAP